MKKKHILKRTCHNPNLFAAMAKKKHNVKKEPVGGVDIAKNPTDDIKKLILNTDTSRWHWVSLEHWEAQFFNKEKANLVMETLIENQGYMWEIMTSPSGEEGVEIFNTYKNTYKELLTNIYSPYNFIGYHIVNCCAMKGPTCFIQHKNTRPRWKSDEDFSKSVMACTRKSRYKEYVSELLMCLGLEISLECTREIVGDLRNNATNVSVCNMETLESEINSACDKIFEKCGVRPNWMITSPEIADLLTFEPVNVNKPYSTMGINLEGIFNNEKDELLLLKDPLFPTYQILLGYKGDEEHPSPYYYCSYIPLTMTPTICDPESLYPNFGWLSRYGKWLVPDGGDYYARIKVENLRI